jgi:predicted dehydrogenase
MRIAVIGAGRNHNGIGAYIARFARAEGAGIAAVLSQDEQTARLDARALQQWGIAAEPYADLNEMIRGVRPAALIIASPATTHASYIAAAIDAGLHILCEKPFIWDQGCDCGLVEQLLNAARARGLVVAMNSQWPFVLPAYKHLCGLPSASQINAFRIELSPLSTGREMIPDSMPHALSLLYSVLGPGRLENITLTPVNDHLTVRFVYITEASRCCVEVLLSRALHQPRPFAFGFNGACARRIIDMDSYRITFTYSGRNIEVEDPLQLSVRDFLSACRHRTRPHIEHAHILETTRMLQQVYTCWPGTPHNQEIDCEKTSQQGT